MTDKVQSTTIRTDMVNSIFPTEAGARQDKRAAKRVREKRVKEKGARQKKSCTDRQESRGMFLV
jgi:hypothetical protein